MPNEKELKEKYGKVWKISLEDEDEGKPITRVAYFKSASFETLQNWQRLISKQDAINAALTLANDTFIGGDEKVKSKENIFSILDKLEVVLNIRKSSVEKL